MMQNGGGQEQQQREEMKGFWDDEGRESEENEREWEREREQTVLNVLEFYTDQKRELLMESSDMEMGAPARFNAGLGLGGQSRNASTSSLTDRRQDSYDTPFSSSQYNSPLSASNSSSSSSPYANHTYTSSNQRLQPSQSQQQQQQQQ
ncbi:hypothetical protein C8J57DRAFT_1382422, partial [Mycena rebaudengoi]